MNTLKNFQILGYTTDYNECQCCGKQDLKGTISILDKAGNMVLHFGTTCAAAADKYDTLRAATQAKKEIAQAVRDFEKSEKEKNRPVFKKVVYDFDYQVDNFYNGFGKVKSQKSRITSFLKNIFEAAKEESRMAEFATFCKNNGVIVELGNYIFEGEIIFKDYNNGLSDIANSLMEFAKQEKLTATMEGNKIWLTGNTYAVKNYLKGGFGCQFDGATKRWYFQD